MKKRNIHPYKESHLRSIIKALIWRVIATSTTFVISYYVFLHSAKVNLDIRALDESARQAALHTARQSAIRNATISASSIAVFDLVIKLVLYYLHERVWQLVNAGWIRKFNRSRRIKKIRKKRLIQELIKNK